MRNQKGITIITLVVTIIILIILAGVSINILLGESGIITKAKEAAKMQEVATIKEEIRIKILEQEIETEGNVTQAKIETILSNYGTVNKNEDGTIKSLTPTGNNYEISYEEIYTYVTSKGENTEESTGDGTNTGTGSDTIILTKEEYNKIIERLDAIDGGTKTSVSIADVSSNMSSIQDNVNSSISGINSNINSLSSNIDNINGKLPYFHQIYKTGTFTSSTTMSYTGISITIPANSYYSLTLVANFNYGQPQKIHISTFDTSANRGCLATSVQGYNHSSCSVNNYTNDEQTLYIWAQYNNASTNTISISGYYVTFP